MSSAAMSAVTRSPSSLPDSSASLVPGSNVPGNVADGVWQPRIVGDGSAHE